MHIVRLVHIVHIVHIMHIGFTWVHLDSLGLILVDLGDFGYRVLNLENPTNKQRISRMSRDPIGSNNY